MGSGESDLVLKTGGEPGSLLTTPFLFLTSLNALPSLSILYPCLWQGLISVLWYFAWVFWAWRKLVSSGLAWVFRSCWRVAVSWSHFGQVDTENMSSALPSWCLESERAGRCLNPCWVWECTCCDGFVEYCLTDFVEKKKKYFYRSWSF